MARRLILGLMMLSTLVSGAGNPYDLLGLPESELSKLSRAEASLEVDRAYRKMARRLHPDMSAENRTPENRTRFSQIREAYEALKKKYREGEPPANLEREVIAASSRVISRGAGGTGNFFADALGEFADILSLIGIMEGEYRYATEVYVIRQGQSDAVYKAARGNGFGYAQTFENETDIGPAFHFFLMSHLDDLLFPQDGRAPKPTQIRQLYADLALCPHPQLEAFLGRWLALQTSEQTDPRLCAPEISHLLDQP